MREWSLEIDYTKHADGSVLIKAGDTWVLCSAYVQNFQPKFLRTTNSSSGWISAEYNMLPSATVQRFNRERNGANGRTKEIERMISRSLRQSVDLFALNKQTVHIDCDVLQADGGTRTAAITGGFVALGIALKRNFGDIDTNQVAAISTGKVNDEICIDLNYEQDSTCTFDLNAVKVKNKGWVEIQSTGEGTQGYYSREEFFAALDKAAECMPALYNLQEEAINKAT